MKNILTAIALGIMTATGVSALAQTAAPGYGPGLQQGADPAIQQGQGYGRGPGMRGGRGNPAQRIQRRLERMSEYLELNESQKTQVKDILEEQHAKRMSMRAETHSQISAVLDEQQRAKFDQMRAQRGKGRPGCGWGRRGGGQGYGPGTGIGPGS
jgi:Spy/CpxP family protein refolding chaperone